MQPNDQSELLEYITQSKIHGASDEFLAALLTRRGWPADDVYRALGDYWATVTGLRVPERAGSTESARDAFLYLLSFATLATWASSLGTILFRLIEYWLPDLAVSGAVYNLRASVNWQMASVAVAFPIYLVAMRLLVRETGRNPERLQSGVRKWLTYIGLLITAGTMIGDLIWFLDTFLTGELTLRFVLKSLAVLGISAAIFTYYLGSLGRNRPQWNRLYAGLSAVAVVTAFCLALGFAGTPARQRLLEADIRRIQDLRQLAFTISAWFRNHQKLPASLSELNTTLADPPTKTPYGYRATAQSNFELCASFSAKTVPNGNNPFWDHGQGRTCYTLDATKLTPWGGP